MQVSSITADSAPGTLEAGQPDTSRSSSLQQQYERIRQGVALATNLEPGRIRLAGPGALDVANRLVVGDVSRLPMKKLMSTFLLREDGSPLAEVYIVNEGDSYLLLTDGAPVQQVLDIVREVAGPGHAEVTDLTNERSILSLDGPFSWELLKDLIGMGILGTRYLEVMTDQQLADAPVTIYRAGKTGEFGYWLDVAADQAARVRAALLETGESYDLGLYGPEALAVCKLENRFINVEREGSLARGLLELNCRILLSQDKGDYLGRQAIEDAIAAGPRRRLIGLTLEARGEAQGLPTLGADVFHEGRRIGHVANAAYSYTLKRPIAVALMDVDYAYVGMDYEVAAKDGAHDKVRTVSAPFILNRSLGIRVQEHSYFDQER